MIIQALAELKANLKKNNKPGCVIISSADSLQRQQARDLVVASLRSCCQEIDTQQLSVTGKFDWPSLLTMRHQRSLFAEHNLIECDNIDNKFPRQAGQTLKEYCSKPVDGCTLIILCSKLSKAQLQTSWGKTCAESGLIIRLWPITNANLPQWIMQSAKSLGITLTSHSCKLLASATEGNLLATQQTLSKLAICHLGETINEQQLRPMLAESGEYSAFDWVDAALAGNARQALKILANLKNKKVEPLLLLGTILRTIRESTELSELANSNQQLFTTKLQSFWPSRRALLQTALRRLNLKRWQQLLSASAQLDLQLKGITHNATNNSIQLAWTKLADLSAQLCGKNHVDNYWKEYVN